MSSDEASGESNRQRRLREAFEDLPEPWPARRPFRGKGEALSRHVAALRARLDWLVKLEEEHGEEQRGMHLNRAERNALLYVMREHLAPLAAEHADVPPQEPKPARPHNPEYIEQCEDAIESFIRAGFTVTNRAKPGVLLNVHDDIASVEVPLPVWFGVRGRVRGQEDA